MSGCAASSYEADCQFISDFVIKTVNTQFCGEAGVLLFSLFCVIHMRQGGFLLVIVKIASEA